MPNAIVWTDLGSKAVAEAYFNNVWPAGGKNLTMKLNVNNITPADTDVVGAYTEAAGGGYAAKTLTNGSWTESNVGGIEQEAYAKQTWTFTGALTGNAIIYGAYFVDADGILIGAQKLDSAYQPLQNNDSLAVTPKIQCSKGIPT